MSISQALSALQKPAKPESKAARFRQQLPAIEATLARNIDQSIIVATLAEHGISMTLDEFRNALYRERKRLKKQQEASETSKTPTPIPTPPAPQRLAASTPTNPADTAAEWQASRDNPERW